MRMKFTLSVKDGDKFISVGNVKPNKSGKSWQVVLFADKAQLLQRSPCGRFINCLMTEDKRPDFGGNSTPNQKPITPPDWLPEHGTNNTLQSDAVPF